MKRQLVFFVIVTMCINAMAQLPYCLEEFKELSCSHSQNYKLKSLIEQKFNRNKLVAYKTTQYDSLGRIIKVISSKENGCTRVLLEYKYSVNEIIKTVFSHNEISFSEHFCYSDSLLRQYFITFPKSNDTTSKLRFEYDKNGLGFVFKSDILWLSVSYENGLMTRFYSSPQVLDAECTYINRQISSCVNYSSEQVTNYYYNEKNQLISVSTDGPFSKKDSLIYQYFPDGSYVMTNFYGKNKTIRLYSNDGLLIQELQFRKDKIRYIYKYSYEWLWSLCCSVTSKINPKPAPK